MPKPISFLSYIVLLNISLFTVGVLSSPFNTDKADKNDVASPNDNISSDALKERNKRNIFESNFEKCLREIKESVENRNENPLESMVRKFGHEMANKIQNIVNPQDDDYFTKFCRSAQTVVNTVQNSIQDANINGGDSWKSYVENGLNDTGSKFKEFLNSNWFHIGAGILAAIVLFAILIKCCKCCRKRSPPASMKFTAPGEQPYHALGGEV